MSSLFLIIFLIYVLSGMATYCAIKMYQCYEKEE